MYQLPKRVAVVTLLVLAGACEPAVEPDSGPGEPILFAAEISEGEVRVGPLVYHFCSRQWIEEDELPPGDDLYMDLIHHGQLDDLSWYTDRGAEIVHRFDASDILGTQVRVRLPRARLDEFRRGALPSLKLARGVVDLDRFDVVFRGKSDHEAVLRETVTAAGGVVVHKTDLEEIYAAPLYTIVLPDAAITSFAKDLVGSKFADMEYPSAGAFCLAG